MHSHGPDQGTREQTPLKWSVLSSKTSLNLTFTLQAKVVLDMIVTMFSEYCSQPFT